MANPRVNILIANYNYEQWIIESIESAINQSYPNIAITIVDDGSTDQSWNKIYKHLIQGQTHNKILPSQYDIRTLIYTRDNRDIPITTIRLDKNYGPSFARNIGIEGTIESSDYYMILDADDVLYKNKVMRCVETAMKLPQICGIVYADYMTLNPENGLERIEYKENFDLQRLYRSCIIHSGSLVSAEALRFAKDQFGYYDNNLRVAEDYDLWLRITKRYTAMHIPECLTLVRITSNNSTSQVSNEVRALCMQHIKQKMEAQNV